MAYRLTAEDGTLEAALRRIAGEQVDKALASIEHDEPSEAVHEVRRRCKMLRGLIRLVRTSFHEFEEEDAAFRAIAHPLSVQRDLEVMPDTLERIAEVAEGRDLRRRIARLRSALEKEREEAGGRTDEKHLLGKARKQLKEARDRAQGWRLDDDGWNVAGKGVAITYGNVIEHTRDAFAERKPELLHRLRKHVRHHWCHARLLRPLWPEEMTARAELADELADLLGFHHDLTVLALRLEGESDSHAEHAPVLVLISREGATIEDRAAGLAGRLLAETAEALEEHWHALWTNWRDAGAPVRPA